MIKFSWQSIGGTLRAGMHWYALMVEISEDVGISETHLSGN